MNYYLRHLGDYAKSAAWLSQTEHGALNLLLDWYYSDEKPIPADMIFHITKAHTREEKRAAEKVIKHFFKWDSVVQGWRNNRADETIAKATEKREKARSSASKRWEKPLPQTDANAMRTHYERSATVLPTHSEGNAIHYSNTPSLQDSTTPIQNVSNRQSGLKPANGSLSSIVRRLEPK